MEGAGEREREGWERVVVLVEVAMRGEGGQRRCLRGLRRGTSSRMAVEMSLEEGDVSVMPTERRREFGGKCRTVAKTLALSL